MPELTISNVSVSFPFEPYILQRAYMEKVIECLENGYNGVLESPTGTGKTLCLLCSALGWITKKKAEFHADLNAKIEEVQKYNAANGIKTENLPLLKNLAANFRETFENVSENKPGATRWAVPKIIYASRTHSQLSQAMQELKRTSYNYMKAAVIGSRDQLCIHPDVIKEVGNSNKIHMCKLKITTRTCSFYHKVETGKDDPLFRGPTIMDIEDLVVAGRKKKCCPYFVSRELIPEADIVFMPYNYLLDPKARKANKVDLNNTIIILDEAHNVEKMCEESASVQITSTEIAVCIDDVTHIMKAMEGSLDMGETSKDFTIEDLVLLKEMLLSLEKTIDAITVNNVEAGETFDGSFIFELLVKSSITDSNFSVLSKLLDSLIQFLTIATEESSAFRRGSGLQKLFDLLTIVFSSQSEDYKERVSKCYKVHVEIEQTKPQRGAVTKDGWIQPRAAAIKKTSAKVVSYWCFSPGFGMQQLLGKNVRSVILTSGTLAPLKPLISELGIPINVRLENPHIVTSAQVCVKIVGSGPDKEQLLSNYENRDNPKYINSLGRTILSFCPVIPHGVLVFFTSYFMLNKCRDSWQASGIWSQIQRHKPIFIEPQSKDVFVTTMNEYYARINDPITKGAIFMAVCRGKVSEGLDFADANGRAVIITGLPFPPFKDPRIILKKKYLQENRTAANEMLSGDEWYFLEATRAVNQAIGRVIRHKDDYGAILLCDYRFNQPRQKNQLSSWIQGHLKGSQPSGFGQLIGELSRFFRNAERTLPKPGLKPLIPEIDGTNYSPPKVENNPDGTMNFKFENQIRKDVKVEAVKVENSNSVFGWDDMSHGYKATNQMTSQKPADFLSRLNQQVTTIDFNNIEPTTSPLVGIHKRERTSPLFSKEQKTQSSTKKRKYRLVPNETTVSMAPNTSTPLASEIDINQTLPEGRQELLKLLRSSLSPPNFSLFFKALTVYQTNNNLDTLVTALADIFSHASFHYLFRGMRRFVKEIHRENYDAIVESIILSE